VECLNSVEYIIENSFDPQKTHEIEEISIGKAASISKALNTGKTVNTTKSHMIISTVLKVMKYF